MNNVAVRRGGSWLQSRARVLIGDYRRSVQVVFDPMPDLASKLSRLSTSDLKRVNVIGLSGSGKSTIARRLGDALRVSHIEMDSLFHGPNWTELNEDDFRKRVSNEISGDRWVLDGNYHSKTHDLKWERATLIVWVNTPFARNMWQSTTRAIQRAWTQEEIWPGTGNRESFRKSFFSTESVVLWALTNYSRIQKRYSAVRDDPSMSHICFIELRNRKDADAFVRRAAELTQAAPQR